MNDRMSGEQVVLMFPPRPIDNERCPVCAGPVRAHLLGWGATLRDEEVCEHIYVGIARDIEIVRKQRERRREAESDRELALASR